jgi:type IV secretion system protein VirD4
LYFLSRAALNLACVLFLYSGVLGGIMAFQVNPMLMILLLFAVSFKLFKRGKGMALSAFGTAAWMTREGLEQAKMIGRRGFILGRVPTEGKRFVSNILALRNRKVSNREAVEGFYGGNKGDIVCLPPSTVHVSVYAPTGAGKGVSCLIPWLLTTDESAVIVDFSGDLTLQTAEYRERKMGHKVVILDPFKEVTR